MKEDIQKIWHLLDTSNFIVDQLKVIDVESIRLDSRRILLGLDAYRNRHLLIPISQDAKIIADRRSSGVQIIPHSLLDQDRLQNFVDLVCLKPHLHELFSTLVNEVLDILQKDTSRPDYICHQILDRWRELLEREPSRPLGMEKLVGIFGELWLLHELVKKNPNSINYWFGPMGARHDFSFGTLAVEVKTTLSRRGIFVEIHGQEQLEPPVNGKLYLDILRIELESIQGMSISDLIESIVKHGGDRYTLLNLLMQVDTNLPAMHEYKNMKFHVYENRIYEVDGEFPHITSESFLNNRMPNGVVNLTYQIDLSTEPPKPLDEIIVEQLFSEIALLIK